MVEPQTSGWGWLGLMAGGSWECWCVTSPCCVRKQQLCLRTGSGRCWHWGESGSVIQILSISLNDYCPSDLWVALLPAENTDSDLEAVLAGRVEAQTVALGHGRGGGGSSGSDGCGGLWGLLLKNWLFNDRLCLGKRTDLKNTNSQCVRGRMTENESIFGFYLTVAFQLANRPWRHSLVAEDLTSRVTTQEAIVWTWRSECEQKSFRGVMEEGKDETKEGKNDLEVEEVAGKSKINGDEAWDVDQAQRGS